MRCQLCWLAYEWRSGWCRAGNLHADPHASIQFLDFATGDSLQLSGSCSILWDERHLPGAQRTMEFQTEKWVHVRGALPLRAPAGVNWSPYNPLPTWQFDPSEGKVSARLQQVAAVRCAHGISPYCRMPDR